MTDRALVVLDQVTWASLDTAVRRRSPDRVWPVRLDYLPRTTPVGHATISTGRVPAEHRVQGRKWIETGAVGFLQHDVHNVVRERAQLDPVFNVIAADGLASKCRQAGADHVVAVAAKNFIPYLFGAWDCDVVAYPNDVIPRKLGNNVPYGGAIGLPVFFVAWTPDGLDALRAAWMRMFARFRALVSGAGAQHIPVSSGLPPTGAALPFAARMDWLVPTAWGATPQFFVPPWLHLIHQLSEDIDDFYMNVALDLCSELRGTRVLLQSRFSTDAMGHKFGPSSPQYTRALERGIDAALNLRHLGFRVAVTSDHGGRDTPHCWHYDAAATTVDAGAGAVTMPPATFHIPSGDHIVGYGTGTGTQLFTVSATGLTAVVVSGATIARSFAASQAPDWLVIPASDARIADRPSSGGGDHGACEEAGVVSDLDNVVGFWPVGARAQGPQQLEDVASAFLSLP